MSLHFSKLCLIWSQSPAATAEIFLDLKHRLPDPDRQTAQSIGVERDEGSLECEFNPAPQEVLKNLPGVTPKNYRLVMSRVENLATLFCMERDELIDLLGEVNGRKLYEFVNADTRIVKK